MTSDYLPLRQVRLIEFFPVIIFVVNRGGPGIININIITSIRPKTLSFFYL